MRTDAWRRPAKANGWRSGQPAHPMPGLAQVFIGQSSQIDSRDAAAAGSHDIQ